jgi:ComF family protein
LSERVTAMKLSAPPWLERILNLLYPPRCGVCRRFWDGVICDDCLAGWQLVTPPYCLWCGRPFDPTAKTSPLCGLCLRGRYRFDGARSVVRYEGIGRETVHAFKFHRKPRLAQPMGERMAQVLERAFNGDDGLLPEGWTRPDFLIPVPLHPNAQRQRGYNQAALLAQVVGELLNIPIAELVTQIRPIKPQMSLGEKERWENVRGAFAITDADAVKGRILVVVDDVMTTGATLHEVARTLKQSGARRVYCLTFARTVSL